MQKLLLFITLCAVLNGALFNRIGSRIAEQPYFKLVFYSLTGLANGLPIPPIEVKYSKRVLPNNLPPSNGNTVNSMSGVVNTYNSSFLLHRLKLYAIGIGEIFAVKYTEKISKPFKIDLLRPPW